MGLITELPRILAAGKTEYERLWRRVEMAETSGAGAETLQMQSLYAFPQTETASWYNLLAESDNGAFIVDLLRRKNMAGKVQLIYIDPPFFSKANYEAAVRLDSAALEESILVHQGAYTDVWKQGGLSAYLVMLCSRLYLLRDLLADTGTVWVHLDWHAAHYVRLLLDEIFGAERFVNEIVWTYKSGGTSKKHFARKHDTLLVYSKGKDYYFHALQEKSYNRQLRPYRFKGVQEYQDEIGWYTLVNMKDVWQIDMVGRTSGERTGYATQKPEELLRRIITACTREGDICADFFCGSGTLAAVAQASGRRWICCDAGSPAVGCTLRRLLRQAEAGDPDKRREPFALLTRAQTQGGKIPGSQQENQAAPHLAAEMRKKTVGGSDASLLTIELKRYVLPAEGLETSVVDEEERRAILRVNETSGLDLLEYWSIDFRYDGRLHKPQQVFFREKKKLCLQAERLLPAREARQTKAISIEAVDLLGNRLQHIIKLH